MSLVVTYYKRSIGGKRPVRERYFVNEAGEKDGLYQRYYLDGQPAQTCTFKNGEKDGVQVSRYENGRIASESTFKRGTQNGSYISYYPDGKIHQTCYFVNGQYEGECRLFNPDGSLGSLYSYHKGLKEGVCEFYSYDAAEKLIRTERQICKEDKCIRVERLESKPSMKVIQIPGQAEETYETYHENGKMRESYTCVAGLREGRYIQYDCNGSFLEDSTYKSGKLEGVRVLFYPGKKEIIQETCDYKNGKPDGLCVRYDEGGQIVERCQYRDGQKIIYPELVQNLFMKAADAEIRCFLADEILDARRSGDSSEAIQIAKNFHAEKTDIVRRTALKFKDHQKCRS